MSFSKLFRSQPASAAIRTWALWALLLSNLSPLAPAPARAAAASPTNVAATKAASILVDRDGDGRADPGDTLRYTATVSNTGTADATGLVISDALDPNTQLVAGSLRVSPLALDDSYTTPKDSPLTIAAPGLLNNDSGTPAPAATPFSGATTAGGSAAVSADGSFSYTPAPGFSGKDTFRYSATNSAGSDSATVTIVVESAPAVASTTPVAGATTVPANNNITIMFDEPVNVTASAFTLECPAGNQIPFVNTTGLGPATSFTLDPSSDMPLTTVCTVTVAASQVTDADTFDPPDQMAADYSFSFTTTDAVPVVISTAPITGATNVALNSTITIAFSEPVTVTANAFTLECPSGTPIAFANTTGAGPATSFTLTPSSALPVGVSCTVTVVAREVHDVDTVDPPDTMLANYIFSFLTESAPSVIATTPANGATNVALDTPITIGFSEPVTVTASAFTLECPSGTPVAFTNLTGTGPATSFTLDPSSDLPAGVTCTVTVVAAQVHDVDTNDPPDQMAANYVFSFTTDTAPSVLSTTPANGATNVALNTSLSISFSEPVTVTGSAFALACPSGTPVTLSNTSGAGPATSFTLTPSSALPTGTTCTLTVAAAQVHDADASDPPDTMAADYVFSFTTDTAPSVTSTTPANAATGVATNTSIVIDFSEPVTVTGSTFALACPAGASQAFTNSTGAGPATSFTLTPSSALPAGATCTVTVAAAEVHDADAGDPPDTMAADYSFSFATDAAPSVTSTTPASAAASVAVSSTITISFSEPVTVTANAFTLECPSGTPQAFTNSTGAGPATSFTLTPSSALPFGTLCTVTVVAAQVHDADASDPPDTMAADYSFSFTTTDTAPTVISTTPANGAVGVASTTTITISFSEPVTVTANAFTLECPSGTPQAFTNSTGAGPATSFTLTPSTAVPVGVSCTATVAAAQVHDADTSDPPDTMAADYVFSFTIDAPPSVLSTTPGNNASGVAATSNITITFSESVNYSAASFSVECPSGTPVAFALASTSPSTSAVLDPSSALPAGVVCTVTVAAAQVHDVDAGDPPDTMAADYTFVFSVPPAANNDAYAPQIIGNVGVNTASSSGFSVLTNDVGPGLSITGFAATSAHGGTVAMNTATGTFSYTPPAGYEGPDSFTYTIGNAAGSATATVGLTVSGMIWFIDNNAAAGDGRLSSPFNSLAAFAAGAADDPGDNIFLYESSTSYSGPITLLNNQRLIGQDSTASLAAVTGLVVPPDSFVLPLMNSGNATQTTITSAGNGINLGAGNTLRGLNVSNAAGDDISGSAFGTLTVRDMSLSGGGRALNLDTGVLDALFNAVGSTGGLNNINLLGVGGTLTMNSGALSGAGGTAFNVSGGNGAISYGGTVSKANTGLLVSIQSRSGGSVALAGNLSCTSGCTGINATGNSSSTIDFSGATKTLTTGASPAVTLAGNTGSTITFSGGGLQISTTVGAGLSATGGGTLNVTGNANTIASTTGTALNISNTTIGASGVAFARIDANGAINGIVLNSTGSSGGLSVTGDGATNGTGGLIQNTTGPSVLLTNTSSVSLAYMNIQGSKADGINGTNVTGLTLDHSTLSNNGDAAGEDGINISGLFGNAAITNSTVTGSQAHNVLISNANGTLNSLTISGSTFSNNNATNGLDGVSVTLPTGSTGVINTISVSGSTFANNVSDGIGVNAEGTSSIGSFIFSGNTVSGNDVGVNVSSSQSGDVNFAISNNPTLSGVRTQVNIANNGTAASNMQGRITNNPNIGASDDFSIAVWVVAEGNGSIILNISGNTVNDFGDTGIDVESRGGAGNVQATIANNLVSQPGAPFPVSGLFLRSGSTTGNTNTLCVNLSGNNINTGPTTQDPPVGDYYLRRPNGGAAVFQLQGLTPSPATAAQAGSFITSSPRDSVGGKTFVVDTGTYLAATCTTPTLPLLAAGGEGPGAASIGQAELAPIAAAALARWRASGISASDQAKLAAVSFGLADLAAGQLGGSNAAQVLIDRDAAGWGWFVDPSPADDAEFATRLAATERQATGGAAAGRMDLLTVLMHELGHVLGRDDLPAAREPHALMAETLPTGVRRSPAIAGVAQPEASTPVVVATPSSIQVNIATLPVGKRVVVLFDVVIATSLASSVSSVSNQATIAGANFVSVLTDDPTTPAPSDPTVTLLDVLKLVYLPVATTTTAPPDLVVSSVALTPNKTSFGVGEAVQITVVIKNQGETATTPFWVDLYLNPGQPPSLNNVWNTLCSLNPCYGMAWRVSQSLAPGQSVTLTSTASSYAPAYTRWPGSFAAGTTDLYVLADSWNPSQSAGASGDTNRSNNLFHLGGLRVAGKNSALGAVPAGELPPRP